MAGTFDTSNLMYVTKAYEEEIKSKAKTIYSDDEVSLTIENINRQLNDIITEINSKMEFVVDKVSGPNGIDSYIEGVHTQIDRVDVTSEDMVPDAIKETTTHPSIMAFKANRAQTNYNYYDFITKEIDLNNESINLALRGSADINPDEQMLTFNVNATNDEWLKIIEFSITYKQNAEVISKSNDLTWKEQTATVSRIISGKFFFIRHDPVNAPTEFIIKAIIQNSDNTGNIIDKKIVDVKEFTKTGNLTYIFDDGPQFDLYFTFTGNTSRGLKIHLGKIVPYRYIARNTYVTLSNKEAESQFGKVDRAVGASNAANSADIDDIYYSTNLQATFTVDKTKNRICIVTNNGKIDTKVISGPTDINHNDGSPIDIFWVKDIENLVFIRIKNAEQDTCYVGMNNLTNLQNLGRPVDDVVKLSTGEILIRLGYIYYFYDKERYTISNNTITSLLFDNPDFVNDTAIVEYDEKYIIQFYTLVDGVGYRILEKNLDSGLYKSDNTVSPEHKLDVLPERINNLVPTNSKLNVIENYNGIFVGAEYSSDLGTQTILYAIDDIVVSGISYVFKTKNVLQLYNVENNTGSEFNKSIKKLINTNLFTFLIDSENDLYIIDEARVVKAISFKEVPDKGWTDKDSVLYMLPKTGEEEYYLVNNAYLQDVQDVVETPNGIVIVDDKGLYLLNSDKNLDCKIFVEGERGKVVKYLPKFDNYGTCGALVTVEDSTATPKYYDVFKHDFKIKESSDQHLRYDYLDLFSSKYQLFTTEDAEYEDNVPILNFRARVYLTFIDVLSPLYNTVNTNNIHTDEISTYGEVFANKDAKLYSVSPNKYGFIKYDGIMDYDTGRARLSDINAVKRLKFIHNPEDNFTYQDCIDTIHKLVKDEYQKYYSDMETVKRTYRYVFDKENSILKKLNTYGTDGPAPDITYRNPIFTRYGAYAVKDGETSLKSINMKNFIGSSTKDTINVDCVQDTENAYDKYTANPNCFKIYCLEDEPGTTFMSNGTKAYKTVAYKDKEFKTPFTDTNRIELVMTQTPSTGNVILRKSNDGIVSLANTSLNAGNIYEYAPGSGEWNTRTEIAGIFNSDPAAAEISIVDFIRIDGEYHVIAKTNTEMKYVIRGTKHLDKSYEDVFGTKSVGGNTNFWIFNTCILCKSGNRIAKYDKEIGEFVACVDIGNIDVLLLEHEGVIYGGAVTEEKLISPMFTIDVEHNYLNNIAINNEKTTSVKSLYYNVGLNSIVWQFNDFVLNYKLDSKVLKPVTNNGIGNGILQGLGGPVWGTMDIYDKEMVTFTQYSAVQFDNHLYIAPVDDNTEPREAYKVGHDNVLSSQIIRYEKTEDSAPIIESDGYLLVDQQYVTEPAQDVTYYTRLDGKYSEIQTPPSWDPDVEYYTKGTGELKWKNYSKLNFGKSRMSRYPKEIIKGIVNYGENVYDLLYIFKRTVLNNGKYEEVDNSTHKRPVQGVNYFKLELNGTYTLQQNMIEFDENSKYYVESAKYEIVSNISNIVYDDSAEYVMGFSPVFEHCVADDYIERVEGTDAVREFKSDIEYVTGATNEAKVRIFSADTGSGADWKGSWVTDNKLTFTAMYNPQEYDFYKSVDMTMGPVTPGPHEYFYYDKTTSSYVSAGTGGEGGTLTEFSPNITYYTKIREITDRFGDTKGLLGAFYYDPTENDIFIDQVDRANLETHVGYMLSGGGRSDVISTEIGIVTPILFGTNVILCLLDNDIREVIQAYNVGLNGTNVANLRMYDTSKYIFVVIRGVDNTWVIDKTTGILSECNPTNKKSYENIVEFEDGSVYGFNLSDTTISAYKHGENGTLSFSSVPTLTYDDTFRHEFYITRIADDGKTEMYLFGKGSSHNVYRLYDNTLLPVLHNNIEILGRIIAGSTTPKMIKYTNDIIIGTNIIYDFSNDRIYEGKIDGVDTMDPRLVYVTDTSRVENFVNDVYPDTVTIRGFSQRATNMFELVETDTPAEFDPELFFTEDNTEEISRVKDSAKIIYGAKQLPVIDKYGNLYYTYCRANPETLEPDYTNPYIAYDKDKTTVRHKRVNFDKLFMTSIGLFGVIGTELYLSKIYDDINDFVLVENFIKDTNVDLRINVQESDHGIFITYKNIYRYDEDTAVLVKVLNLDDKTVDLTILNVIDALKSEDKYWTKITITEQHELWYMAVVDGSNNIYKYNKSVDEFELWDTVDSKPVAMRETVLGVLVATGSKIKNVSTKTLLRDPGVTEEDNPITDLYGKPDFIEVLMKSGSSNSYNIHTGDLYLDFVDRGQASNDDVIGGASWRFYALSNVISKIVRHDYMASKGENYEPTVTPHGIIFGDDVPRYVNHSSDSINIYKINVGEDGELTDELVTSFKHTGKFDDTPYVYGVKVYDKIFLNAGGTLYVVSELDKESDTYLTDLKRVYDAIEEPKPLHVGYTYNLIGENTNVWNNTFDDTSNVLHDKYLMTAVGLARGDSVVEEFYDRNSYYENDLDAKDAKSMNLRQFYKEVYMKNWEQNKFNHIFKNHDRVMNTTSRTKFNPLKDMGLFDDQHFEIELSIFTAPVSTDVELTFDVERVDENWYVPRTPKHDPVLPYYPFS